MKYNDSHDLIRRYVELFELMASTQANDATLGCAIRCAACAEAGGVGMPTKIATKERTKAGRQKTRTVCSRCREPFSGREVVVFKTDVKRSRTVGARAIWLEGIVAEFGPLRPLFESVPRDWTAAAWSFARFASFAVADRRIGTVANASRDGRRRAETAELGDWSVANLEVQVAAFHGVLLRRGRRARLLRRPAKGGRNARR